MERLGPYELIRELARGGMGVVYEARHPDLPRRLALKQILATEVSPETLARFRREAEALARVHHPNVVSIHELGSSPRGPYLVEALVPGRTLEDCLVDGPLEPRAAAEVVAALASAVEAVHAAGILHRDLKPANVILTPEGTPVLLDFGLARDEQAERLTQTGELLGTPAYMAPEQAVSQTLDARTDVYGLGALLFAASSGRAPFGGSLMECLRKVLEEEPAWPSVPSGLLAIMRRALAKEPERRYPGPGALRADLERFLRGEAVGAPRRWLAPVLGGAVLLGVALGAWVLGGRQEIPTAIPTNPPTNQPEPSATPVSVAPPPVDMAELWRHRRIPAGPLRIQLYRDVVSAPRSPARDRLLKTLRGSALATWDLTHSGPVTPVGWGPRVAVVLGQRIRMLDLSREDSDALPALLEWTQGGQHTLARVGAGVAVGIENRVEIVGLSAALYATFGPQHGELETRFTHGVLAMASDPTANRLAVIGTYRDALVIDLGPGRVRTVRVSEISPKEVALRGDVLAVATRIETGGQVLRFSLAGAHSPIEIGLLATVTKMAFLDGVRLAVGGANGTLHVWDGVTRTLVLPPDVRQPRPAIRGLGLVGSRWLVTVACRGGVTSGTELRVYDAAALRQHGPTRVFPRLRVASLDITDDGRFFVVGTFDGRVELWATPVEPSDGP